LKNTATIIAEQPRVVAKIISGTNKLTVKKRTGKTNKNNFEVIDNVSQ